jgi:hypothetical protein
VNSEDFVYKAIFSGCIAKKVDQSIGHKHAVMGLDDYKKNKIAKKVSHLIEDRIKQAVKDNKVAR